MILDNNYWYVQSIFLFLNIEFFLNIENLRIYITDYHFLLMMHFPNTVSNVLNIKWSVFLCWIVVFFLTNLAHVIKNTAFLGIFSLFIYIFKTSATFKDFNINIYILHSLLHWNISSFFFINKLLIFTLKYSLIRWQEFL